MRTTPPPPPRRVLVVDDDPTVTEVVSGYLDRSGFTVDLAADGVTALERAHAAPPDLVVLDLMLPGLDGLQVCRRLRAERPVPVVMLTARGDEEDRVLGLEVGADDYVTKPFSPRELVLRVESVLRRAAAPPAGGALLGGGGITLDPAARAASDARGTLTLTLREFDLLAHFLRHPGRAFSRQELMSDVWGWDFGDLSTVTVHVRRLRHKIETDPAHPLLITTVWGVGYRFDDSAPGGDGGSGANGSARSGEAGSPVSDLLLIVLYAALGAAAVGLAGLLALVALRRRSMAVSLAVLTAVAVGSMLAGTLSVAWAMLLNKHDLGVVTTVCAMAAASATVSALLLGRWVIRGHRALEQAARALGEAGDGGAGAGSGPAGGARPPAAGGGPGGGGSGFVEPVIPMPAELASLSRQLADTSARLAVSRERERALESSRRELVAWISHDLRSPLAGLRAMAEALEDGIADDPARYHRRMRGEVERLSDMVGDLFELSRIQAGSLNLSRSRMSVYDLVSDAIAGADALAAERGVQLADDGVERVPVEVDGREMARVLANLLTNAIHRTPADGTVAVSARGDEDGVVLTVTDTCGGIPADDLPRVFDTGWRGTDARTPPGGAGLGLAIVPGIVEAHQGRASVRNVPGGCRFEVTLPAAP